MHLLPRHLFGRVMEAFDVSREASNDIVEAQMPLVVASRHVALFIRVMKALRAAQQCRIVPLSL